jgi:predicted RND superfamily exporter protein
MEEFARFWAFNEGNCVGKDQAACTLQGAACQWSPAFKCHSTKTEFDYPGLPRAEFLTKLGGKEFKQYKEHRADTLRAETREYDYKLHTEMTGYEMKAGNSGLKFAFIGWNATFAIQNTAKQANEWYDRWEEFFSTHGKGLGGFQTTDLYLFMVTQNEMVKGAVMGIILSIIVAFLVLLIATKNWLVATLGIINICCIVVVFLGIVPAIGWSLGEYECIFMILTVGLSVDYTAHLLHAYNHSKASTRLERSHDALAEMGISVLNSAITTLMAASILFACGFHFFFQFGAFIFIIIFLSIVLSITFLMPIMCLVGPQNNTGKIYCGFLNNMVRGKSEVEDLKK